MSEPEVERLNRMFGEGQWVWHEGCPIAPHDQQGAWHHRNCCKDTEKMDEAIDQLEGLLANSKRRIAKLKGLLANSKRRIAKLKGQEQ